MNPTGGRGGRRTVRPILTVPLVIALFIPPSLSDEMAKWNVYTGFMLDPVPVEFQPNRIQEQERRHDIRFTEEEMDRIRTDLSRMLTEAFTREMTGIGNYVLRDQPAPDVMRISPRIVNLSIDAPQDWRENPAGLLADSSGHMTVEMEIRDSVSGNAVARVRHTQEGARGALLAWSNVPTKRRSARLMLQRWARSVRTQLDEARAVPSDAG